MATGCCRVTDSDFLAALPKELAHHASTSEESYGPGVLFGDLDFFLHRPRTLHARIFYLSYTASLLVLYFKLLEIKHITSYSEEGNTRGHFLGKLLTFRTCSMFSN